MQLPSDVIALLEDARKFAFNQQTTRYGAAVKLEQRIVELQAKYQAEAAQPESQAQAVEVEYAGGDLSGVRPCCGNYFSCQRPCTPRGRQLQIRESKELEDSMATDATPPTQQETLAPVGEVVANHVAIIREQTEHPEYGFNCAVIEWLFNPVPEGELLAWQEQPGLGINRECNACDWTGPELETLMLGAVGPLCPKCRETTEITSAHRPDSGEWQRVPKEPTEEMIDAAFTFAGKGGYLNHPDVEPYQGTDSGDDPKRWHRKFVAASYRAWLAAAPKDQQP